LLHVDTTPTPEDKTMVEFDCPLCGRPIAVNQQEMGTATNCPHCDGLVRVPRTGLRPAGRPRPDTPARDYGWSFRYLERHAAATSVVGGWTCLPGVVVATLATGWTPWPLVLVFSLLAAGLAYTFVLRRVALTLLVVDAARNLRNLATGGTRTTRGPADGPRRCTPLDDMR
jgi:hypothetical protein